MFSMLKILAIAAIAGLGGLCTQAVESEDLPDETNRTFEQTEGELGLNIFGFSLHTDRSAGYNEVNPGIGLRYAFCNPAPRWTLFGDASIYYDSNRQWAKYVALGPPNASATPGLFAAPVVSGQTRTSNPGNRFFALS